MTLTESDIICARLMLQCTIKDDGLVYDALKLERETGLSIARGEITVVRNVGKPRVMITRAGLIAYANKQPDYQGIASRVYYDAGLDDTAAECEVCRRNRPPTKVRIYMSEFNNKYGMWTTKPKYTLEKIAIDLALSEAYPIMPKYSIRPSAIAISRIKYIEAMEAVEEVF